MVMHLSTEVKALVVGRHQAGEKRAQIARAMELPWSTVNSIVQKYVATGTVVTSTRSGRPLKLTERRKVFRK